MAFFEDLGNNIKNVGNTISSGAKDLTQKAKLNSEIGQIKKDIDVLYRQLGEKTYWNNGAPEEEMEDVQPLIDNIDGAFTAIKAKEDEIAQIDAEAQARKEEEEARKRQQAEDRAKAAAAAVCQNCGAKLLPDSKFCVQCGTPVPQPEPVPEPEPAVERVCPNCGAPYEEDACFCIECGTKLK